jgi:Fe-S-cluster containining protein
MTGHCEPIAASARHQALDLIYQVFDEWAGQWTFACRPGCAVCCTHGVTLSESEGERILTFLRQSDRESWLLNRLAGLSSLPTPPACTTNEFARACLEQEDIDPGRGIFSGSCPLLQDNRCSAYSLRPFACRSFVSTVTCQPGREAVLPSAYLTASTAVGQLIEHLDRGRLWGTMIAMLHHLSSQPHSQATQQRQSAEAAGLLTARPLPGFLLGEEDFPRVAPLLEDIFRAPLGEGTIEDLLNSSSRS